MTNGSRRLEVASYSYIYRALRPFTLYCDSGLPSSLPTTDYKIRIVVGTGFEEQHFCTGCSFCCLCVRGWGSVLFRPCRLAPLSLAAYNSDPHE